MDAKSSAPSKSPRPVVPPESAVQSSIAIPDSESRLWKRLCKFALEQHLPLGLLVMVTFGYLVPQPGIVVGQTPINVVSVCSIFFISGLQIQITDVRNAFRAYTAVLFGLVSILGVSPLLLFVVVLIPLEPREFTQGLALFVAMPTTVSASVAMTSSANGNAALALFFSATTNLLGVFTAPLFASYIFRGSSTANSLDIGALLLQLGLTIVLPLVAGMLMRVRLGICVARRKLMLKLLSSAFLIIVPWTMMSLSSAKLQNVALLDLCEVAGLATALHSVLFALNFLVSSLVPSFALPERKAVVICSAQKTINTALSIILALPHHFGDHGLLILPCIIFQFSQTIIDSVIVARWASSSGDNANDVDPSGAVPPALAGSTSALAQQCDTIADTSPVAVTSTSDSVLTQHQSRE